MEVTEVRVRLAEGKQDRLRAFCSVTLDNAFVIRDVKVIQGEQGLFVAMPSRKLTDRCPSCRAKNQLRSRFCSDCGAKLTNHRAELDDRGRPRLYVDIAHPVNAEARTHIEKAVLAAYQQELTRSAEPGYEPAPLYEGELEEPDEVAHHLEADERHREEGRAPVEAGAQPPRPGTRPERPEPPQESRELAAERQDLAAEQRELAAEQREPAHERREPAHERREPAPERREPPRTPHAAPPAKPSPPPAKPSPPPAQTKRRFGEGIFEDGGTSANR